VDFAAMTPDALQRYADALGGWSHEIPIPGVRTGENCSKSRSFMEREWETMALPDLDGKSVIDVGGADGGYAFMAEEHGARRVACLDYYIWSLDRPPVSQYHYGFANRGEAPPVPHHKTQWWRPAELPGKRNFNLARALLNSNVEALPLDFMHCDLEEVGRWDIVLFLGLLYHLDDPLGALRRLHAITGEQAIIETEAIVLPGCDQPLWQLYPHAELNYDWTNWWAPNLGGLLAGLGAAGFSNSEVLQGPPDDADELRAYRLIVRASR
jgi:tRNA (mo5U34)-methyltransferase